MKIHTTTITCDNCDLDGLGLDEADTVQLQWNGNTYNVDICHGCIEILCSNGEIVNGELVKPKGYVCPTCDSSFTTQRGLNTHMGKQRHG